MSSNAADLARKYLQEKDIPVLFEVSQRLGAFKVFDRCFFGFDNGTD
jgi:hypothetical protein